MNRPMIAPVLIASIASSLGCGQGEVKAVKTPTPTVQVVLPVVETVTEYVDFSGHATALRDVQVRARVGGRLDGVLFEDGDEVREGDVLFRVDPRPYRAELDRAEAKVVQAEAHLKRLEADRGRVTRMHRKGVASGQDLDRTQGDHAEAVADLGAAKAMRDEAALNLAFTEVAAPIAGRISRRFVDPGNLIKGGVTPLTTIVALDPIYVYFDVDERTMLRTNRLIDEGKVASKPGAEIPVIAALADEPEAFPHRGTINFTENKVDSASGTLRLRCSLENPLTNGRDRIIAPGMFVRVRMPVGEPREMTLVPEAAVGTDQERRFLYIVDDRGEVVYRPVKLGQPHRGMLAIEEGLKPGEKVITGGLARVRPGAKVTARLAPDPKAPSPRVATDGGSSPLSKASLAGG